MQVSPRLLSYSFVDVAAKRPDLRETATAKLRSQNSAESRFQLGFYGADVKHADGKTQHMLVAVGRLTVDTSSEPFGAASLHAHCVGEFQFVLSEPLGHATATDPELHPYLLSMTEPTVRIYLQQLLQGLGLQIQLPISQVGEGPVTYEEVSQGSAVPFESRETAATQPTEPTLHTP